MVKIARDAYETLIAHARSEAPLESCGYLAGTQGACLRYFPLVNVDKSEEHFSFDPKEQFAVFKEARSRGWELYAVVHSHPRTPARPSVEDIRLAFDPAISYVIVSLAGAEPAVNAYKIKEGKSWKEELEVVTC